MPPETRHANALIRGVAISRYPHEADQALQIILGGSLGPDCRPNMDTYNALLEVCLTQLRQLVTLNSCLAQRLDDHCLPTVAALHLLDRPADWVGHQHSRSEAAVPVAHSDSPACVQGVVLHKRMGTGLSEGTPLGSTAPLIQAEALIMGCRPNKLTHALYCELAMLNRREEVGAASLA